MRPRQFSGTATVITLTLIGLARAAPPTASPDHAYRAAQVGKLPADIPITLADTQILVDGIRVNGQGPYRFLLDTGAMGGGRVDVTLVNALGLQPTGSVEAGDGAGARSTTLPLYQLDELTLGPVTFQDVRVLSRDYNQHAAAVRGHIDGVLGIHLFRELLLTIDYPARRLRLDAPRADTGSQHIIPLIDDGGVPTIEVTLAGKSVCAHLDTGAMGGVAVPAQIADELPTTGSARTVGEARTLSGVFPIREVRLDGALEIAGHRITNPDIVTGIPLETVNIGGRALASFVITLDQRNQQAHVTRPEQPGSADIPRRTHLGNTSPIELPMVIEQGRPVITARINGQGPYPFVLDTGAGTVVLARSLVRELRLTPTKTVRIGDPSDPEAIEADEYRIDELATGPARFETLAGVSWNTPMLEGGLGRARGIIGLPTFAHCLLTIDYHNDRVLLARGALSQGDGAIAYRLDDGVPTIDLSIGDVTIDAHIDSGNMGALTLPESVEARVPFASPPQFVGRARTPSGSFDIRRGHLATDVTFAGVTVERPEVNLTDRFSWANIGYMTLRAFVITIDQVNRRVRFAKPGDPLPHASATPNRKRYGFMLAVRADGVLEVTETLPDGIARRVGLRVGDQIVEINGRRLAELGPDDQQSALRSSPLKLRVRRAGQELEINMSWNYADPSSPPVRSSQSGDDVDHLLNRMRGTFSIAARHRRRPDQEFEQLAGISTWTRERYGRFVHEAFELTHGDRRLEGEVFLGPTPVQNQFELVQLDAFNPVVFHVAGTWDADREQLVMQRVWPPADGDAVSARPLRWVYRLADGGSFVKEMHVPGPDGAYFLASDYHYQPTMLGGDS